MAKIYGPCTKEERDEIKTLYEVHDALLQELRASQQKQVRWWKKVSLAYNIPKEEANFFDIGTCMFGFNEDDVAPREDAIAPEVMPDE